MEVGGKHYRTIWMAENEPSVRIIDQTRLPHEFAIVELNTVEQAADAIGNMLVRGAPLIGATAAYGLCLAIREDPCDANVARAKALLIATRPTAVNLRWGVDRVFGAIKNLAPNDRAPRAFETAARICDEDVEICQSIGQHGLTLIKAIHANNESDRTVNVMTHCNAGWLATVDWGTALAPVYAAHQAGIPIHVWVSETRPRNQGASLTAWELAEHGVNHTVIVDNACGHLMQNGHVDLCIVGTDRTTADGDVCNKIGTYLKALAAFDNDVPFYVGLPSPTIDWELHDGIREIPIEQRGGEEVSTIIGRTTAGVIAPVRLLGSNSTVRNDSFDVTPAKYITGLITERGICDACPEAIASLFPEHGGYSGRRE